MSFNIRYGSADDGENSWAHRRAIVTVYIAAPEPDIVALQEVEPHQLEYVLDVLPHYGFVGRSREAEPSRGESIPILFDERHWRLDETDSGTFWLSDTPEVPGSMSWGNRLPRIVTWARLVHVDTARAIYIYNVHLDHESANARKKSAELIAQRIAGRRHKDPVIVLGDFNAEAGSPPLTALTAGEERLVDAFLDMQSVRDGAGTFHGFEGSRFGRRIDHVFVQPDAIVSEALVIQDAINGRYPSDHFPIAATVTIH